MVKLSETAARHLEAYGLDSDDLKAAVEGAPQEIPAEGIRTSTRLSAPWEGTYLLHSWHLRLDGEKVETAHIVALVDEGATPRTVLGVHAVPMDLLYDREQGQPLEMLKALTMRRYGLEVSLWDHRMRFATRRPAEPPLQCVESTGMGMTERPAEGHVVALQDSARCVDGVVQVLLAFALDATAVRADVGLG